MQHEAGAAEHYGAVLRVMSGGLFRNQSVDVIERHGLARRFRHRDHTPGHVGRHFAAPLLVVRDAPLRHSDGRAEGGLRQAESLTDLEDIVHAANTSAAIQRSQ